MSAFKGKSVKNKSKLRKQKKELKFALKQQGSPLGEVLSIGRQKEVCDFCGEAAYKSDSINQICENRAYKGVCKNTQESIKNKLNIV